MTFFCSIALLKPLVIKLAASSQPKYSSIITPLRITEPGLILFKPACFGAVPCVASKIAALSPIFAPGAIPRPPTIAAAASET